MKLEYANLICPKCGNGNYMRHLVGKGVKTLDVKCINCNSYFNFDELSKQKTTEVVKSQTNGDRIRQMTDEELTLLLDDMRISCWLVLGGRGCKEDCDDCIADWLKSPAEE